MVCAEKKFVMDLWCSRAIQLQHFNSVYRSNSLHSINYSYYSKHKSGASATHFRFNEKPRKKKQTKLKPISKSLASIQWNTKLADLKVPTENKALCFYAGEVLVFRCIYQFLQHTKLLFIWRLLFSLLLFFLSVGFLCLLQRTNQESTRNFKSAASRHFGDWMRTILSDNFLITYFLFF